MGQNANDAAVMGAQILSKEECASGTERNGQRKRAAAKDVQIVSNEEECAGGMGHIAILTKNLLHSLYMGQHTMIRLPLFPISALPQCLPTKKK
jgi:hypothetical protein